MIETGVTEPRTLTGRTVPERWRGVVQRSVAGVASPREAIKAKCLSCVNFEDAQERIRDCHCTRCPLFAYRPYQEPVSEGTTL